MNEWELCCYNRKERGGEIDCCCELTEGIGGAVGVVWPSQNLSPLDGATETEPPSRAARWRLFGFLGGAGGLPAAIAGAATAQGAASHQHRGKSNKLEQPRFQTRTSLDRLTFRFEASWGQLPSLKRQWEVFCECLEARGWLRLCKMEGPGLCSQALVMFSLQTE